MPHLIVLLFSCALGTKYVKLKPCTLSQNSLSGLSSLCYKTTLITGGVGGTGVGPPTFKLGTFLLWPLALSLPIYSNFQVNGAYGETLKPPDTLFCFWNKGSGGVSPEAPLIWKLP